MKKTLTTLSLVLLALAALPAHAAATYQLKQTTPGMKSPTCELAGTPVSDGATVLAYASASSSFGGCLAESRTCTQGTLSGSYPYASCTENPSNTTWGLLSDSRPTVILLSNNNLTVGDADWGIATSVAGTTAHSTGKWYFEVSLTGNVLTGDVFLGLTNANWSSPWAAGIRSHGLSYNGMGGPSGFNGNISGNTVSGFSYGSGDTVMFAVDLDSQKIWVGKNCSWAANGNPSTGANPAATLVNPINVRPWWSTTSTWTRPVNYNQSTGNFGGSAFSCTVPTGFHAGW